MSRSPRFSDHSAWGRRVCSGFTASAQLAASHSARSLVDPELLDMLDAWPIREISTAGLEDLRTAVAPPACKSITTPTAVDLEQVLIDGRGGAPQIPVRIYRPSDTEGRLGCVIHLHGGGFICGSAAADEHRHRAIAADLGCVVIAPDYRLAPEAPFPAAVEDTYAVFAWAMSMADQIGVDPAQVGAMGESAGGGLAACLALLVRDLGEYSLAFLHLTYPMLDDRTGRHRSEGSVTGQFIWTAPDNKFGWAALLGPAYEAGDVSPYAAAARAEDLSGLPPVFLATAALDLFVDENIDFARRLIRAGTPVELHVFPGGFHGFDLHPTARIARAAREASVAALRRFLAGAAAVGSTGPDHVGQRGAL